MNIKWRDLGRITENIRQSFIEYGGVRINGIGMRNNIKRLCFNEGELEGSSLKNGFWIIKGEGKSEMAVKFSHRRREYMVESDN